jgi:NAD(P)-dependent dehydrogenase (short-subunit alcohol dehydrogenase family)
MTKIVLITGGARGLGRHMALACAKAGHDVLITYRNQGDADALVQAVEALGKTAVGVKLDVTEVSKFDAFVTDVGRAITRAGHAKLDAIVQNAGTGIYAPYAETTEAQLDELYRTHLKAPFLLTQKLLPLVADGGRIINLSTALARISSPGWSAYAAMKGAIEVLSRYQAAELARRGITVNAIAPGAFETDFLKGALSSDEGRARIESKIAMGRLGQADDIGPLVALLLDDATRWMTGQRIEVSGGMSL